MISLELPKSPVQRFRLIEHIKRDTDGMATGSGPLYSSIMIEPEVPRILDSWIELSEVVSTTLTKEWLVNDKELLYFLDTQKDKYRFDYIRFGCTFRTNKKEEFEKAYFFVQLEIKDSQQKRGPVVWSMKPEAQYDTTRISTKANIGAKLKLISAELGSERERNIRDYFIRAYYEGKGAPFWEFTSTEQTKIKGSYILHMIVRSNINDIILGVAELLVIIKRKIFYLIPAKQDMEYKPTRSFRLPSDTKQINH